MNVSFSMNGNSDCVVMDGELVEDCLVGVEKVVMVMEQTNITKGKGLLLLYGIHGKETITKKNQMVFKQLFEFATGVSVANDIKKSNGKRVREIDAKFSDLGLEKRIKQVKRDLGRYL
ncbi:hypothetical protein Tco_0908956 [Tanacetum coccineum]|uniref:Uncharacterized protein n=1 Tax=Tanacetum coccineum TaxID=301880 RepID=A0ABQ5CS19_9ASTR